MSEEFESLDAAAVAGAQGCQGWNSVLLSPIDVFATSTMEFVDLLKPAMNTVSLGAPIATATQTTSTVSTISTTPAQPLLPLPVKKVPLKPKTSISNIPLNMSNLAHIDIGGTTAARSRQMTDEERRVMLYKRKLRNRASAARSREKRCRTILELSNEVSSLLECSNKLAQQSHTLRDDNERLARENGDLRAQNERLRALLDGTHSNL